MISLSQEKISPGSMKIVIETIAKEITTGTGTTTKMILAILKIRNADNPTKSVNLTKTATTTIKTEGITRVRLVTMKMTRVRKDLLKRNTF